jgi:hypothetical protein
LDTGSVQDRESRSTGRLSYEVDLVQSPAWHATVLIVLVLNPFWQMYWRERQFEADKFAVYCNQGRELINYLDDNKYSDVATPYFFLPHPYHELRIDEMLDTLQPAQPVAARATQQLVP